LHGLHHRDGLHQPIIFWMMVTPCIM